MDKKTWPTHMLPMRDPPQNKTYKDWKWRVGKKTFQANGPERKAEVARLISDKTEFKTRAVKRDPEGHFIIIKGRIHQESVNKINVYALNIGTSKYIRKILEDFTTYIDSNILIVCDFKTPLSIMNRSSKQNINKDIAALNDTLYQMNLTETYITFRYKHILLKCTYNIFKVRTHDRTQI